MSAKTMRNLHFSSIHFHTKELKMNERGQLQISFGMIFSIIIIIATMAVAFYVITYFLDLSNCTKVGAFWDSLDKEVEKAWNSDITQSTFSKELPGGITNVCFGNFTMPYSREDQTRFDELGRYYQTGRNAWLYPPGKACEIPYFELRHATTDRFFCVQVKDGKASVRLSKTSFDPLVKLSRP